MNTLPCYFCLNGHTSNMCTKYPKFIIDLVIEKYNHMIQLNKINNCVIYQKAFIDNKLPALPFEIMCKILGGDIEIFNSLVKEFILNVDKNIQITTELINKLKQLEQYNLPIFIYNQLLYVKVNNVMLPTDEKLPILNDMLTNATLLKKFNLLKIYSIFKYENNLLLDKCWVDGKDVIIVTYYNMFYCLFFNNSMCHSKKWFQNCKLHRDDGPAQIYFDKNNNIIEEKWCQNGQLHRDNGPAIVKYYENGKIDKEIWHQNDKVHRDNGPAVICYYDNSKIKIEEWFQNNNLHRDNGPATVCYYENGIIKNEEWRQNQYLHRVEGPAILRYNKDGYKYEQLHFIFGIQLSKTIVKPNNNKVWKQPAIDNKFIKHNIKPVKMTYFKRN